MVVWIYFGVGTLHLRNFLLYYAKNSSVRCTLFKVQRTVLFVVFEPPPTQKVQRTEPFLLFRQRKSVRYIELTLTSFAY